MKDIQLYQQILGLEGPWQIESVSLKSAEREIEVRVSYADTVWGRPQGLLKGKAADTAAGRFCRDIQGWVHTACQAHRQLCRGRWRAKAAKRKGQALRALCATALRYPKAEKFRQHLSGPEQKLLFTCFCRPEVPSTNNQAERSLRPLVIMRKVIQGTRSEKGLENHGVLRSLFETARRQGNKPHEFFLALFTKDTPPAQAALYCRPLPTSVSVTPSPPIR